MLQIPWETSTPIPHPQNARTSQLLTRSVPAPFSESLLHHNDHLQYHDTNYLGVVQIGTP